jgi:ATP synthase protein I
MKNGDDDKRRRSNDLAPFALVGEVGLTIALSMLGGVLLGRLIDSHFGTAPIATLLGLLLGLAVGIYGVYRLISSL